MIWFEGPTFTTVRLFLNINTTSTPILHTSVTIPLQYPSSQQPKNKMFTYNSTQSTITKFLNSITMPNIPSDTEKGKSPRFVTRAPLRLLFLTVNSSEKSTQPHIPFPRLENGASNEDVHLRGGCIEFPCLDGQGKCLIGVCAVM